MKELSLFVCDICGCQYNERKKAEKCENSHRIPKKVKASRYRPITDDATGYPDRVLVTFDDGVSIEYTGRVRPSR